MSVIKYVAQVSSWDNGLYTVGKAGFFYNFFKRPNLFHVDNGVVYLRLGKLALAIFDIVACFKIQEFPYFDIPHSVHFSSWICFNSELNSMALFVFE